MTTRSLIVLTFLFAAFPSITFAGEADVTAVNVKKPAIISIILMLR
ncbi:MAG: hypothetical protein ABFR82_03760 [Nitrospirota bacterium]